MRIYRAEITPNGKELQTIQIKPDRRYKRVAGISVVTNAVVRVPVEVEAPMSQALVNRAMAEQQRTGGRALVYIPLQLAYAGAPQEFQELPLSGYSLGAISLAGVGNSIDYYAPVVPSAFSLQVKRYLPDFESYELVQRDYYTQVHKSAKKRFARMPIDLVKYPVLNFTFQPNDLGQTLADLNQAVTAENARTEVEPYKVELYLSLE